jgi:DNA/RNA endonuclease G (NUC1)
MNQSRVLMIASATLMFGASTTAFLYEMDILTPKHLSRVHAAETRKLNDHINEQQQKIDEMRKRKEELHNIVHSYQTTELNNKREQDKQSKKYPALEYGLPGEKDNDLFYYDQYIAKADLSRKIPKWVLNTLNANALRARKPEEVTRERSNFGDDPSEAISTDFRAQNDDYWHSGYDRGHMVPAGDMRTSQHAMDETFYLNQNIVPQNARNNRGYWRRLEQYVRGLPKEYRQVHVVTGPLFLPSDHDVELKKQKNEFDETIPVKRKLTHDVIGDNQVHVPTHLYKVVLAEKHPDSVKQGESNLVMSAFLLPNEPIQSDTDLQKFEVPVNTLEKKAGLHFFTKARQQPDVNELRELTSLCVDSRSHCRMAPEDPSLEYITDIQDAKTTEDVERVWNDMIQKGVKPHDWTKQAYDSKLERIKKAQLRKQQQQQEQQE